MEMKIFKPKDQPAHKATAGISKKKMSKVLRNILIVLFVVFVGFGIYAALDNAGYVKALKLALQIQKQTALSKEDKAVLNQLKKIMVLPEDINPTMAVITDVEALKKQQPGFFADVKNGDRLIIYPTQAIVFDAAANKIIKVGPIQFNQAQVTPVNFAIYNSLKDDPTNAKSDEMETKLKAAFNNAVVTVKANSAKFDYPKTLVVDLVGNNKDIEKIAQAIGANLSGLPIGEKAPEGADVLVIIGKE